MGELEKKFPTFYATEILRVDTASTFLESDHICPTIHAPVRFAPKYFDSQIQ